MKLRRDFAVTLQVIRISISRRDDSTVRSAKMIGFKTGKGQDGCCFRFADGIPAQQDLVFLEGVENLWKIFIYDQYLTSIS